MKNYIKKILHWDYIRAFWLYRADVLRFVKYSAAYDCKTKGAIEANIIVRYHVLEKGLTMPDRHLPFGTKVATQLVDFIYEYERRYVNTSQVSHAIAVLREYLDTHVREGAFTNEDSFWQKMKTFCDNHREVSASSQINITRAEFYADKSTDFPKFSLSRHTVRNYSSRPVTIEKIERAVSLASSSPSACNRQHVKVRCISNKEICKEMLSLQGGNRGFGHLADKVLIITSDVHAEIGGVRERNDPWVNGGIYLMNLCYALHYYEVAHCILTCSFEQEAETKARRICAIPDNEVFIAMLSCGEAPEKFSIALSPKRNLSELFSIIK